MGFLFGVIGALLGAWMISEVRWVFGFAAGFLIAWLLQRLAKAQETISELVNRVSLLEQRNQATSTAAPLAKETPAAQVAAKKLDTRPKTAEAEAPPPVESWRRTPPKQPVESWRRTPDAQPPPKPSPQATAAADDQLSASGARPGIGDHTIAVAKRWLTTGNVPVKMGVIVCFFGVAFLLKYAVDNAIFSIPIGLRYLAVAGFAAGLLWFGWKKRAASRVFALSVQGGGIGVLFLTVFAAYRLHGLLSPGFAFLLLVLVTAAAGFLAIKQESRAFAILGTTGGFLAPLLVSTGSGNHVSLFSYYLVLNCAILGVAWYRPWRELNIIGFVFTFGVGTIWGYQYYVPALFATTEPFLILYFLFYTVIAVLFAFRQRPELRGYVDGTLLFGTPSIAFALQSQLLDDSEYGLAISAAVVAAFYAATALWLRRTQNDNFKLLTQAFIALAVAFATLAIPLALDDRWTAIAWALEGAALVWIGVRQSTTLAKMTGTALAFGAGSEFLNYGWVNDLGIPVLNGNFFGGVLIAATALYSAYLLLKDDKGRAWQQPASIALLVWGLAWWFGTGFSEISDRATYSNELIIAVAYFGASFLAMNFAANRLQWLTLWHITLVFLPLAGGAGLIAHGWSDGLGWPVLNGNFLGGAMIAWMALYSSRKLATDERADVSLKRYSLLPFVWGLLFWFGAGSAEILDRVTGINQLHWLLLFGSLSLSAFAYAGKRFAWLAYTRVSLALLPALVVFAFAYLLEHDHFLQGLGAAAWLTALGAHLWVLYSYEGAGDSIEEFLHGGGAAFFIVLAAQEVYWQLGQAVNNTLWSVTAAYALLAGASFALLFERQRIRWPFAAHRDAYLAAALSLAAVFVVLVVAYCWSDPGDPRPLSYLPVLNPLDLLSVAAAALVWYAPRIKDARQFMQLSEDSRLPLQVLGGLLLILSTLSIIRVVHHVTGVPWESGALFASVGVQSSLSIYWAILGLGGMVLGTRNTRRSVWMAGAALMGVVVLKLFAVDLGNSGTVARIVTFLVVGLMLLVVGYFSPVPPRSVKS